MRRIISLLTVIIVMTVCFYMTGCGSSEGENKDDSSAGNLFSPEISIDDIQWEVKSGVTDGVRVAMFEYTNNSKYDIVCLNLDFAVKDGTTEEELEANSIISEKASQMDHIVKETTIEGYTDKYTVAGGVCENQPMTLDGTIEYLTDADVADLFQPDMMTVCYLSGGEIHTAYYDYKTEEFTNESTTQKAVSWSKRDYVKTVPKLEASVVVVEFDDEDSFLAEASNVSKDDYEAYEKACQDKGFTENQDGYSYSGAVNYSAENADGLKLELNFYGTDETMTISLEK